LIRTADPLVAAALVLDKVSIGFRVELRPDEALEFARRCTEHGVTNAALVDLITAMNDTIPPMLFGPDNPNNGRLHHVFEIGKQYSRVLYLHVYKAYLPRWTRQQWGALAVQCKEASNADETDVLCDDSSRFTFRWWWD
jgi:hypothetical protein